MYTIKEASVRSGIGISLLRAWERRYGVVKPVRTESGYRLYDDDAIDRLRAMRQLIADGWSARQAGERVRESSGRELALLIPHEESDSAAGILAAHHDGTQVSGPTQESLVARLVGAARDLDAGELERALDEAFSVAGYEVVAERVVMPALRAIGEAWERQEVSIAGEHAASHAVLRRLAMAYEAAARAPADKPIIVGLGPGSRHELGAFSFAIAARRAGLPILYLGPDLPAESWIAAAHDRDARAAVIGAPTRADIRRAREVIAALEQARPGLVIAVGGGEAARAASGSGAIALPPDLDESVGALRDVLLPDPTMSANRT